MSSSSAPLASERVVDLCFEGSDSVQTSNLFPIAFLAHGHLEDPNFLNFAYCCKQVLIGSSAFLDPIVRVKKTKLECKQQQERGRNMFLETIRADS